MPESAHRLLPRHSQETTITAQDDIRRAESGPTLPPGWWFIPVSLLGAAIWALCIWVVWGLLR
jgi:hypothetical protein